MIGGFILANGPDYRTIKLFSEQENHHQLKATVENKGQATELCCFWIARPVQCNTPVNLYIWLRLAFVLRFRSNPVVLFGTNSGNLAKLYATTPHSKLINHERVGAKTCYIFLGKSNFAIKGIGEIVAKKLQRVLRIKTQRSNDTVLSRLLSIS